MDEHIFLYFYISTFLSSGSDHAEDGYVILSKITYYQTPKKQKEKKKFNLFPVLTGNSLGALPYRFL